jgi:hypothetical protein
METINFIKTSRAIDHVSWLKITDFSGTCPHQAESKGGA